MLTTTTATKKVADLKDESPADYSQQTINRMVKFNQKYHRHGSAIVIHPSGVIIAGTALHRANQAAGIEEVELFILDIPEVEIPHARNLYDRVPENYSGLIAGVVEAHRYYQEEGTQFREECKHSDSETLKEFIGSLFGWSHTSIQKMLDIAKCEFALELIRQMDEGSSSLDKAYCLLKEVEFGTGEPDTNGSVAGVKTPPARSKGVMGGNTSEFQVTEDEALDMRMLFSEQGHRLHEQLTQDTLPEGISLRVNRSKNGSVESFSCTYQCAGGIFTAYYVPGKGKAN